MGTLHIMHIAGESQYFSDQNELIFENGAEKKQNRRILYLTKSDLDTYIHQKSHIFMSTPISTADFLKILFFFAMPKIKTINDDQP